MKHSAAGCNKRNLVLGMSPLALLTLSACGGSSTAGVGSGGGGYQSLSFSGNVVKGPLSNALVGLDYDGDGVVDSSTVRTDADGNFSITPTQASYTVVAVTNESTIDTSSGTVLSGITLKAPQGASVVTPTTTLMEEGNLTAAQVASVLGLPYGIDPLTFNPFAAGVSATDALAVEKTSQQIMSVVNAFASAAEGAGATEEVAFTAALNSLVEVVKTKAAASGSLDLTDTADLALIKDQAKTDMATTAGVNTTAFNALADDIATAVENVNAKIEAITDTDLTSDASKNIFSTAQVLADQVKTAAEAEVNSGGSGNITFTDANVVNTAASNKAPKDIALSTNTISEAASSLVIGTLTTTDSDQTANVKFTYALAEIMGSDHAAFSINQATGELSLKAQPDFETKSSYSVTILSTDEGGKTLSKTFSISVSYANEAPTLTVPTGGMVTEDANTSMITGSLVGADVENDTLTYLMPGKTAVEGSYSVAGSYGTLVLNASTGAYTYALNNSTTAVQALGASSSETEAFSVQVTDGSNTPTAQNLSFMIKGANDAPTVANAIADQTIAEDSALSFEFNSNVFADDLGDSLTYTATLSDGSALPSWLAFNAATRTFSGTPLNGDVGVIAVKVTAFDSSSAAVTDTFNVTVTNTNDAPTVANAVADQTIAEDSALSFQFNSNVFADVDAGDSLTYTTTLSDGSALPSWLAFDAATRTFSGTPLNGDVGVIAVKVTATDSSYATVADTFNLTITNTNDAPAITSTSITTATEGSAYSYTFAASDVDANDTLTYSTSTLPSWLNFNATTGVLSGTPGEADAGLSSITLTATDAAGISVTQTMKLATTTGSISVGGSHTGTLDVTGDKDWVAVELTQGQAYGISLSGNSGSYVDDVIEDPDHDPSILNCGCPSCLGSVKQEVKGSEIEAALIDPYIYVYDKDGNLIKSDDDSGSGRDSYLTFTPTYSGTYYIEARAWSDKFTGDYKIEVSEVVPLRPTGALEWGNAAWNTSQTIDVYFADNGVTVSDGKTSTGFTQAEETSIMGMLSNVTNFANISFQITEIQAGADIRFAHASLSGGTLGYMNPQNYNSNEGLGVLTNNSSYWNDTSMQVGGFMYGVVVHEIGHGLGLAHPHDTGGGSQVMEGVSYSSDKGDYGQMNQSVYTVMSYNEGFAAHPLGLPSDYGSGYMGSFAALDMAVLQSYYGANTSYNNGSTTYSLGSKDYYETIWDGGGTDEITMGENSNAVIDLRAATLEYEVGGAGFVSYNANAKGGYTIANGVVIENAKGGGGNDTITGNYTNNIIYGGSGAGVKDILTGNLGADIFISCIADATTDLSLADTITDFYNGTDKIGLEDRFFSDLSFSNDGGGTKIVDNISSKILFWLDGIDSSLIDSEDFITTDFV